jgi:dienelactone hydrolase
LSIWFNGIQPQFRTIDGLTIRFAQSEQRDDQALLLSPWPESLFAFEPTWDRLAEHTHLVAIDLPGFGQSHRNDVEFAVEGGVTLRGWLFVPDGPPPHPAITMAHGFAGVKEHGLERFAAAFAAAGFVVLVHDHRGFGASGGAPRFDVDPWVQIADWRRAISFLESQPVVDENRIGLWGTSYAGGHAIVLGATDRRLRAVVAQVPTTSGYQQSLRRVAPDLVPALEAAFADDERRQFHGAPPATQAVVSADPSVPAAYRSPQALAFYTQPVPEGVWENTMTLRSTRAARMYEPGTWVARVSPTPC